MSVPICHVCKQPMWKESAWMINGMSQAQFCFCYGEAFSAGPALFSEYLRLSNGGVPYHGPLGI